MLDIKKKRNGLGLWEVEATLNLPEIKVTIMKAHKDQIKYDLQNRFTEIVNEFIEKHATEEL